MKDFGLLAAGYLYVNSDGEAMHAHLYSQSMLICSLSTQVRSLPRYTDCWMLANRSADGSQIANPDKFPQGFKTVADEIHALGLKSGLYTAKGPHTCAKYAASCDHEVQDAAQWASWGIDYGKCLLFLP